MVEDEKERLARELSMHFKYLRENFSAKPISSENPANLLRQLSDADIESISNLMAPFLVKQLRNNSPTAEADLANLAQNILATPGLFGAFAKASSATIYAPFTAPPDQNRDGAQLFYRKALKKIEFEQYKEARSLLKKSISLCDDFAPAWEALADALEGCGQREQSRQAAARAAELRLNS